MVKSFVLAGKGVCHGLGRLFTDYPNPTWAVITICVVIVAYIQIGMARSERDSYGRRSAQLQMQLDSCLLKETKIVNN